MVEQHTDIMTFMKITSHSQSRNIPAAQTAKPQQAAGYLPKPSKTRLVAPTVTRVPGRFQQLTQLLVYLGLHLVRVRHNRRNLLYWRNVENFFADEPVEQRSQMLAVSLDCDGSKWFDLAGIAPAPFRF